MLSSRLREIDSASSLGSASFARAAPHGTHAEFGEGLPAVDRAMTLLIYRVPCVVDLEA